jgi:C1A family cysteine protease
MKKTILTASLLLVLALLSTCENGTQDYAKLNEYAESDQFYAELAKTTQLGGLVMMDRQDYEKLPEADLKDFPNLIPNEPELRSTRKVLTVPPVFPQGSEGSCVAFTVGYIGVSYYLNKLKRLPYSTTGAYRSPEFLYNNTKSSGDCKAGSDFVRVLEFLRTTGVCSWSEMPYSASNGCTNRGTTNQRSQAQLGRIQSWRRVNNTVSNLKGFLDNNYPVLMGFQYDQSFEAQTKTYPYTYTRRGGVPREKHAVTIIGYDDSRQVFIVQNSWGTGVHDRGIFYIAYALMPQLVVELFVIDPV